MALSFCIHEQRYSKKDHRVRPQIFAHPGPRFPAVRQKLQEYDTKANHGEPGMFVLYFSLWSREVMMVLRCLRNSVRIAFRQAIRRRIGMARMVITMLMSVACRPSWI